MVSHCQFCTALVHLEAVKASDCKLSTVDRREQYQSQALFTVSFEDAVDAWVVLEQLFEHQLTEIGGQILYFDDVRALLSLCSKRFSLCDVASLRLLLVYDCRGFRLLLSLSFRDFLLSLLEFLPLFEQSLLLV